MKWIKISEDKPDGPVGDSRDVLVTNGKKVWTLERYIWNEGINYLETRIIDGYDGYYSEDYQDPTHFMEITDLKLPEVNNESE